jgi:hypothetical protein
MTNRECPFCGSAPRELDGKVHCENHNCRISGLRWTPEQWNTRHDPRVDEFQEFLELECKLRYPDLFPRIVLEKFNRIFRKEPK